MNAGVDHLLADCRRIFFRDLSLQVSIGFHARELRAPQQVLVDIDLYVPLALTTPHHDQVTEVLDYDFVHQGVLRLASARHYNLQETLLEAITDLLFAEPRVRALRVSTAKPGGYTDCRLVGIEIFRSRPR